MTEVVSSIRRVTDIMGEISAASTEQANGVSQVGEAVTHMDQTTQQNAALVEEMAAAASSLKVQAQDLVQVVSTFKLSDQDQMPKVAVRSGTPKPTAFKGSDRRTVQNSGPASKPAPKNPASSATVTSKRVQLAKPVATAKAAGGDDDWETF